MKEFADQNSDEKDLDFKTIIFIQFHVRYSTHNWINFSMHNMTA